MTEIGPISGLIVDMDGVLWRGGQVLPGAADLFGWLRSSATPVTLMTNNATASPAAVQSKLKQWGIQVETDEVLTSALATAAHMHDALPHGARVLVIGEHGLREAIAGAGFEITSGADGTQAVAVGMDHELTWDKLAEATLALRSGARFFGTNPDPTFPTERGQVPGNGAILAALRAASEVEPTVIGKPEPHLFQQALERMQVPASRALMLGDRLSTDILGAQRAGIRTGLLLTGVTSREQADASAIKPDYIFEDLVEFLGSVGAKLS